MFVFLNSQKNSTERLFILNLIVLNEEFLDCEFWFRLFSINILYTRQGQLDRGVQPFSVFENSTNSIVGVYSLMDIQSHNKSVEIGGMHSSITI